MCTDNKVLYVLGNIFLKFCLKKPGARILFRMVSIYKSHIECVCACTQSSEVSYFCNLKDWCWNWNSNTLATWCEELTHLIGPWFWERLTAGREGDDRGWDGWMALPTQCTWAWVGSGSWWWTVKPGMLWFMGSQRVRHDWDSATELNWTNTRT